MAREAGRGNPKFTRDDVESFLRSQEPPLAGTTQIAEQFDVARPSVIERLDKMQEDGVIGKRKVGQSYAWYLEEWKTVETTGPAPGGGGGSRQPPEQEKRTSGWFSSFFSGSRRDGMDLPGIFILAVLAVFGWRAFKSAYSGYQDDTVAKTAYAVLTGGFIVGLVAIGAQIGVLWYASTSGPVIGMLSYGVGAAVYTAFVLANGGVIGLPARTSKRLLESIGVEV